MKDKKIYIAGHNGMVGSAILRKLKSENFNNIVVRDVTSQPLFYLALVAVVIGVQLFLAGFIGELVTRNSTDRNKYLVQEEI